VFLVEQFLLHNKPKASSACVIVVPPPVRTFPHHEEQDQRVLLYLSETVVGALVVVLCVVGGGEARTVGGRRTWTGLGRCHDTSGRRQVNPTWPSARWPSWPPPWGRSPCSLRRARGTPPHGSCCGRSSSMGFDRWKRCGKRNASDLEHRGCWGGVRCGRWRRLIGTLAIFGSARERKGNQVREMGRSETDRLCSGADSRPLLFLTAGAICLCGRPAAAAASGGTGVRARGKSRSMRESAIFSGPG
jgi:hypothetical protein